MHNIKAIFYISLCLTFCGYLATPLVWSAHVCTLEQDRFRSDWRPYNSDSQIDLDLKDCTYRGEVGYPFTMEMDMNNHPILTFGGLVGLLNQQQVDNIDPSWGGSLPGSIDLGHSLAVYADQFVLNMVFWVLLVALVEIGIDAGRRLKRRLQ